MKHQERKSGPGGLHWKLSRREFVGAAAAGSGALIVRAAFGATPDPKDVPPARPTAQPRYSVEGDAIVACDATRYFGNRPLYVNNGNSFVLTGDRPLIRYVQDHYMFGTFMISLVRGDKPSRWLHFADDIVSRYQAGRTTWLVRDPTFAGATVSLSAVPMSGVGGMAIHVQVQGAEAGDRLIWAYGGAYANSNATYGLSWEIDPSGNPQKLERAFSAEECAGNDVRVVDGGFSVHKSTATSFGKCSVPCRIGVGDASSVHDPIALMASSMRKLPIVWGAIDSDGFQDAYLSIRGLINPVASDSAAAPPLNPPADFAAGLRHKEQIASRIVVSTPDAHLNAIASAAAVAVDGVWYPPTFVHGAMGWNIPFPGWRTIYGGTVLGWHDRVRTEAEHYIGFQVRSSSKVHADADPAKRLCLQSQQSRYYGAGRIDRDQDMYNMQEQFFDQIVYDWRATADPQLESLLRPALELHLQWMRECFDPDEDGVYESYINTWPTDSVWYNGGGAVESSMYAYRGHGAARDMARRANDRQSEAFHTAMLEKIRRGFFEKLWIPRQGHAGTYREQSGHKRLHEDAWLYSIFLPIDAGDLLTLEQAAQSLRYTEISLQNDQMPLGGRTVFFSNWVPNVSSVRANAPGENYHLALAYFQTGLAEDGWDILRGTFMQTGFGAAVPGNLGALGVTDFGDFLHPFCRTLVEGLFGYAPDYPNSVVNIAPQFPAEWNDASIKIPDVTLGFERKDGRLTLSIELAREAEMAVRLPVHASHVDSVTINGQNVQWELLPGFGQSIVRVHVRSRTKAVVAISTSAPLPQFAAKILQGNVGETIVLRADRARIVSFSDPQATLNDASVSDGVITGTVTAGTAGHHTVIARVDAEGAPQLRLFHIDVTDLSAQRSRRAKALERIPKRARWETVDISATLNADIRNIFRQKYLSPRPDTVSVRIGVDGYSPWTFPYWKVNAPVIELDRVSGMRDRSGRLVTPQGVPFHWGADAMDRNVAFTSLWDNWPDRVSVPLNKSGDAVFLLVAGSTNPMQCHISNAVITFHYADDVAESLELIPPINYWNLAPITASPASGGSSETIRSDYTDPAVAFVVPKPYPQTVELGKNCRAMLLNHRLRAGVQLHGITLETLSQDVVVGLMGLSIMNPG
jgi:hypothetical protein